jgi:hypothetical protein
MYFVSEGQMTFPPWNGRIKLALPGVETPG